LFRDGWTVAKRYFCRPIIAVWDACDIIDNFDNNDNFVGGKNISN
jgi:hypothetical protein